MIHRPDLDVPRRPKKDRPVSHDWRPQPTRREPTPRAADLAVNALGWALETARDELLTDLHHEAKRLGLTQLWDAPSDPLSKVFIVYDKKIDRALETLERALR
jgi:hypothetical protein